MNTSLRELEVLTLDCQASAASPANGILLEIGWTRTSASATDPRIETRIVRPPSGTAIPRRVERVTGLCAALLAEGVAPEEAWRGVAADARSVALRNGAGECPAVIHFARFERPYLLWLEGLVVDTVPLRLVCTHQIACRLLPDLPRRGVRNVATPCPLGRAPACPRSPVSTACSMRAGAPSTSERPRVCALASGATSGLAPLTPSTSSRC